jgi:hypothetical protein
MVFRAGRGLGNGRLRLAPWLCVVHDTGMGYKTITIDDEAYKLLKERKYGNESFSDVIKKEIFPVFEGEDLHRALRLTVLHGMKHSRKPRNAKKAAK